MQQLFNRLKNWLTRYFIFGRVMCLIFLNCFESFRFDKTYRLAVASGDDLIVLDKQISEFSKFKRCIQIIYYY